MTATLSTRAGVSRRSSVPFVRATEFPILIAVIAVSIVISMLNPAFASIANMFAIIRLLEVNGMLALAVLLVLVSGGIDVSFPAIANITSFSIITMLGAATFRGTVIAWFGLALVFGILLGLLNGFFIAKVKLPSFVVTLGTASLFYGTALFFMGTTPVFDMPPGVVKFSQTYLFTVPAPSGSGTSSLHVSVLILIGMAVALAIFLRKSTLGRSIYAVGGNADVAERSGVNVTFVRYFVYAVSGGIASVAGVTQASLLGIASPVSLQGSELGVIAGVVLGGAVIFGGKGTVVGAMLGTLLLTIVQNSLVLVGIPNTWQLVAVGAALIVGTVIPAQQASRRRQLMGRVRV